MDEPKRPSTPPGTAPSPADKAVRAGQERGSDLARQAQGRATEVAKNAGDQAAGLAQQTQDRVGKVAEAAQGRATDVLQQARDTASDLASSVQERLGDAVGGRKDQAAEAIGTAAEQAHKAADTLRDIDQHWLSDLVGASADELGAFAEMIRTNDLNGLLQRVRGLAHRQPALFAGASVATGFALARMARIAMEQPSGYRSPQPSYRTATAASGSVSERSFAAPIRATPTPSTPIQAAPVQSPNSGAGPEHDPAGRHLSRNYIQWMRCAASGRCARSWPMSPGMRRTWSAASWRWPVSSSTASSSA